MSSHTDIARRDNRTAARGGKSGGRGGRYCCRVRTPGSLMSDQGVKHDEQLAHACGERNLGFLTRGAEAKIKRPQHWIASRRHQRAHVEYRAHFGATAPDRSRSTHLATVAIERRDSD